MAKQEKNKKVFPVGLFVSSIIFLVLGFAARYLADKVGDFYAIVYVASNVLLFVGGLLLLVTIIVTVVRIVKNNKKKKAEASGNRRDAGRGRREEPARGNPRREEPRRNNGRGQRSRQSDHIDFPYESLDDLRMDDLMKRAVEAFLDHFMPENAKYLTIDFTEDSKGYFEDRLNETNQNFVDGCPELAFMELSSAITDSLDDPNNPHEGRFLFTGDLIQPVLDIFNACGLVGTATKFAYMLNDFTIDPDYYESLGLEILFDTNEDTEDALIGYVRGVVALHNQDFDEAPMAEALARESAAGLMPEEYDYDDCDFSGEWMDNLLDAWELDLVITDEYNDIRKDYRHIIDECEEALDELVDKYDL